MPTPRETAAAMFATAHEMLADAARVAENGEQERAEVIHDIARRLVDLAHTVVGWHTMRDIDAIDDGRLMSTETSPWIAVADRLPPPNRFVLSFGPGGYRINFLIGNDLGWGATHWMLPPEPPKESA